MKKLSSQSNRKALSFLLSLALFISLAFTPVYSYAAQSTTLSSANVTITNNVGIPDIIYVRGLRSGDIISAYLTANPTEAIASYKVRTSTNYARFEVPDGLLSSAGSNDLYLTRKSVGNDESNPLQVSYPGEPQSIPPYSSKILVNNEDNSTKILDKVIVTGLRSGDVVKVYDTDVLTVTEPIGVSNPVNSTGKAEIAIKDGLLDGGGSVWVSVTNTGRAESSRVESIYDPSETTTTGGINAIVSVINNYGANDYIYVANLYSGDVVEVFDTLDDFSYGRATVANRKSDAQIKAKSRRVDTSNALFEGGGSLYIKITTPGKETYTLTNQAYDAENVSSGVALNDITIVNNAFTNDTVTVNNLYPSDKVEVHKDIQDLDSTTLIKSGIVPTNKTSVTLSLILPEISTSTSSGSVKVRVISTGQQPSTPITVTYSATAASPDIDLSSASTGPALVAVTNNAITADQISFANLEPSDEIKIYKKAIGSDKKDLLATGKVAAGKNSSVINVQLPNDSNTVYGELRRPPLNPSINRIAISYGLEQETTTSGITAQAINNANAKDIVKVQGIPLNALVKVYGNNTETVKYLSGGMAKCTDPSEDTIVSTTFPMSTADKVYIRITEEGKKQSLPIEVLYGAEQASTIGASVTAIAVNAYGNSDTISFAGLDAFATVKLYSSVDNQKPLTYGTTKDGQLVLRTKLDPDGGSIWFSVTTKNMAESTTRTEIIYASEVKSSPFHSTTGISVINNINTGNIPDYVSISPSAITSGDAITTGSIVRVYKGQNDVASIGAGTFKKTGDLELTLTGKNVLPSTAGSIWLTHQLPKQRESEKYQVGFNAETVNVTATSSALAINNAGTYSDYILVYGLDGGDQVQLNYFVNGTLKSLKTTVAKGQSQVTFSIALNENTWTSPTTDPTKDPHIIITKPGSSPSTPIFVKDIKAN